MTMKMILKVTGNFLEKDDTQTSTGDFVFDY